MLIKEIMNKNKRQWVHKTSATYQHQISGETKRKEERRHQKKATTRSRDEREKGAKGTGSCWSK